jgi:long-chain fatty acid transport protein
MNSKTSLLLMGALACLPPPSQGAETLAVVPDSAQALSTVGGRYANLHDASAVRTSPANILYIDQTELLINASVWNGGSEFQSSIGAGLDTEDPWKYLGSVYAVLPVQPGRLALGLGLSAPYGLDSSYPRRSDFKYLVPYEARLLTLDLTPAVAFKVSKSVNVGIGLDIMYSELTLKQVYPWSVAAGGLPFRDGEIEFDGDGWGIGGYAGITWEIAKHHRLSLVGRLPLKVEYEGDFDAHGFPAALGAAGFRKRSDFESDITFPGSIAAGYGVDVNDRLTLGFDFMWSANSSHDDVPLKIGSNQALLPSNAVPLDWKNAIDVGTGLSYKLDEQWTVRAGYLFSENSQKDVNYTPSVPSGDRHYMSVGLGWRGEHHGVDLAYAYVLVPDRHVTGAAQPAFNGDYENAWHVLTLSYTRRF